MIEPKALQRQRPGAYGYTGSRTQHLYMQKRVGRSLKEALPHRGKITQCFPRKYADTSKVCRGGSGSSREGDKKKEALIWGRGKPEEKIRALSTAHQHEYIV